MVTEDLKTRLSRVHPGDWVKVKHIYDLPTIEGEVHEADGGLRVQGVRLLSPFGAGALVADLLEHHPASLTAEQLDALAEGSIVVDSDGDPWALVEWPDETRSWTCITGFCRRAAAELLGLAPLTLVREGTAR